MPETIREAPAEAVKAAVKLKGIFMGIQIQRGTHTTQRVESKKSKSEVSIQLQLQPNASRASKPERERKLILLVVCLRTPPK